MGENVRRRFMGAMGACLLWGGAGALAQGPARRPRVGWMNAGSSDHPEQILEVAQAFRALGYPEGEPGMVMLFAEFRRENLDAIAADLVAMRPEVIFSGATVGTLAAQRATTTIPIVFAGVADPVGAGFVDSLARPGRNITGISSFAPDSAGKSLDLLRAVVPRARRIGVLRSANPGMDGVIGAKRMAARDLGMTLQVEMAESLAQIEAAFEAFRKARAEALVVLSDTPTRLNRDRVSGLAAAARLPAIYSYADHVEAGGLMSFGPDPMRITAQVVGYMDRILKGARPGDLAVQGPRDFELALNHDAARALGIAFPRELVLRANRVVGKP